MPVLADLFCGTGAFSVGFEQTGEFQAVLGIDIRPTSVATFEANHRNAVTICDDIVNVHVEDAAVRAGIEQGGLDVIVAGPPCQGFSSIRPYRSINEKDARNNLYEQLVVFVAFFRPRFVVFENVVGLLHHKNRQTLEAIKRSIEDLGYTTNVAVLNAANYGVPQTRERVILLARRGTIRPAFPEPTHYYDGRSMAGGCAIGTPPLFAAALAPAVTVAEAIYDLPPVAAGEGTNVYRDDHAPGDYVLARRKKACHVTLHVATRHTPRMLEIIKQAGANRWALPPGLTTSGFSSCYSRLHADHPSTTITVNFVHPSSNRCIHPIQDRALTPREGARLQSFDDDFEFCGSRTEVVKQIGEAVPPLLGRAIAQALLDQW